MPEENWHSELEPAQHPVEQEVGLLYFDVPKMDNKKLARELGAQPIDFWPIRKRFKSWFFSTFKFTYSTHPEENWSRITNITLSPWPEAIYDVPDGANLFLYIDQFPWEAKRDEFMTFLSFYQPVFKMLALEERARIFADNGPDQQEKFADWEARSILLEIIRLRDPRKINFSKSIQARMDRLPKNVQEPPHIREDRAVWIKRRPGIGMLFTNNIIAQEYPEYDIPYLDELLCYNDGMFFNILISITRKIPKLWWLWITAHHELLADTQSETHKLFCAIFGIPWWELFEEDGSIVKKPG